MCDVTLIGSFGFIFFIYWFAYSDLTGFKNMSNKSNMIKQADNRCFIIDCRHLNICFDLTWLQVEDFIAWNKLPGAIPRIHHVI